MTSENHVAMAAHPQRRLRPWLSAKALLLALFVGAGATGAHAEGEIEGPAGQLPGGDGGADAPADLTQVPQDPGPNGAPGGGDKDAVPRVKKGAKGKKKGKKKGKDPAEGGKGTTDAWESAGAATPSVAEEVTNGIRVEDIVEPPSDFRYAAFGKPDPFVPPMLSDHEAAQKLAVTGVDPLEIPIVSPLQRFALKDLNVIGIWQLASGERKAMIFAKGGGARGAGEGIIVRTSDPVGNRGGKILSIGDDYVTVREFMLSPDGTRQYEDQQMYMGTQNPDDAGGKIRFTPGVKETQVITDKGGLAPVTGGGSGMRKSADSVPGPAGAGTAGQPGAQGGGGTGQGGPSGLLGADAGGQAQQQAAAQGAGAGAGPAGAVPPAAAPPAAAPPAAAQPAAAQPPLTAFHDTHEAAPAGPAPVASIVGGPPPLPAQPGGGSPQGTSGAPPPGGISPAKF